MSSMPRIKRGFHFGKGGMSWCTKCNGSKCLEDVVFLSDIRGNVQGYMIDSEKLEKATANGQIGDSKRKNDSAPPDGIYKRCLDVKQLLSRSPAHVNTVRFSSDVLSLLLLGVEGCDYFIKGERNIPCEKYSKDQESINLNRKAIEVLSGKTRIEGIQIVRGSGYF